jgi:hypothetical protein
MGSFVRSSLAAYTDLQKLPKNFDKFAVSEKDWNPTTVSTRFSS